MGRVDAERDTLRLGILGHPLGHSLSPVLHAAFGRALGLKLSYERFPVTPDRLAAEVTRLRTAGLRGVNVTIPHKQAALALCTELSPEARGVGAVNTLVFSGDGIRGDNTDVAGFLGPLRERCADLDGVRALVLGAGGAARAVVFALVQEGVRVTVTARRTSQAQALVCALGGEQGACLETLPWPERDEVVGRFDLVLHTTPLGQWPHVDASPLPEEARFKDGALVYDLVYNPRETRLLRAARAAGCEVQPGLPMLAWQGLFALERWLGRAVDREAAIVAGMAALAGDLED